MNSPFYADWTFWSFVIATTALAASQLPPARHLLRKASIDIEIYGVMLIDHHIGSPSVQLHAILRNTGGKAVRIEGIELEFVRDRERICVLAARGYFESPGDKTAVLLTTFSMKPDDEWRHLLNFFNPLPRDQERVQRQLESNLRNDILAKLAVQDRKELVSAEAQHVKPLCDLALQRFPLTPGDYIVNLVVRTTGSIADASRTYRAVLFESDIADLQDRVSRYEFGEGVYYPGTHYKPVAVSLTK